MELGVLARMAAFDLGAHAASIEIGLLAFAGVVVLVLYGLKIKRAHDQKLRKAASAGYHDFDVARYGGTAPGESLIEATVTKGPQALAPSFSAPQKGSRRKDRSTADPLPIPTSFGTSGPDTGVPAFDTLEAQRMRPESEPAAPPVTTIPPPPPPSASFLSPPPPTAPLPPAPRPDTEESEADGPALPLLVPPPPPSPGAPPSAPRGR